MRGRAALERRFEELREQLERPRFLLVRAILRVHDHSRGQAPCRCCASSQHRHGSPFAAVVEVRVLEEIVIDLETGSRRQRAGTTPEEWTEFESIAEVHEITLRCSVDQVKVLLDESGKHLLVAGGNRSGKTTLGLYWLALQWLRRGGTERRFWLVASTLPKAYRLLQKLFKGTGESPPVLPRALVKRMPPSHRSGDLVTEMVDGSWIDLRYFEGDPGAERLKSDAIVAALVDEAAHLPASEKSNKSSDSLTALKGRCLDADGRLFLASTPRPGAVIKTIIVDEAAAFERLADDDLRRTSGEHPGARWMVVSLSIPRNPWLDPEVIRRELAAAKLDDPATRRDYFGEWIGNSGPLWVDFDTEKQIIRHEARYFSEIGPTPREQLGVQFHVDVTATAVRFIAGRQSPHVRGLRATNYKYLLGQDINCHPLSTCVLSFTAPPDETEDRDRWHVWVWDVVTTHEGHTIKHAEKLASTRFARVLRPTDGESPFAGVCVVTDATAISRDPTVTRYGNDPQGLPDVFAKFGFDVRAPSYTDKVRPINPKRYDSHLLLHRFIREGRFHVHQRCGSLIKSLCEQQAGEDGVAPDKTSHDAADILASPIDALRYPLWAAVHGGRPAGVLVQG